MAKQSEKDFPVTLKFHVESFRHIPSPNINPANGVENPNMYIAICDVKSVPDDIPMDTNPREQNLNTNVAKRIRASLLDESMLDFYLLNRGLLLSAKDVHFNNYSNELSVEFDDPDVHGDVDGGHTYRIILENRDKLEKGQQFVTIEILTGVESIFQSLAAARNTSTQVPDQSIAELENRFDIIKNAIKGQPYANNIFFKQYDSGDIDCADLISILTMFNITDYPDLNRFPTIAYSSKKKCIDAYIQEHKRSGESMDNVFVKMTPIIPDIFRLYDAIETSMNEFYRQKNPGGRYGAVKGVIVPKNEHALKSKFFHNDLEAESPNGFLYPILGSFRALVKEENGYYTWKVNPFEVLNKVGPALVDSTVSMSRSLGNNPQSTGKDVNLWKTLYMTVAFEIMNN